MRHKRRRFTDWKRELLGFEELFLFLPIAARMGISSAASTIRRMINTLRRMSDDELPTVLSTLAASGGTSRSVESWRQDRMTALLLGGGGEKGSVSAVMPMARRTVAVAPGRTIEAGWLSSNQFASRMGLRRQTRETAGQWAELLPELDALFVIRRDEGSLAGRWYGQTGFHDVLSIRCLYLDMESPPDAGGVGAGGGGAPGQSGRYRVEVVNAGKGSEPGGAEWDAGKWQPQMLAVYREIYAACGGTPVRTKNFWAPTLAHHYYGKHYQFQVVGLWGGGGRSRCAHVDGICRDWMERLALEAPADGHSRVCHPAVGHAGGQRTVAHDGTTGVEQRRAPGAGGHQCARSESKSFDAVGVHRSVGVRDAGEVAAAAAVSGSGGNDVASGGGGRGRTFAEIEFAGGTAVAHGRARERWGGECGVQSAGGWANGDAIAAGPAGCGGSTARRGRNTVSDGQWDAVARCGAPGAGLPMDAVGVSYD